MKRLGITTFLLYVDTIQWVLSCSGGSHEDRDDNLDGNLICDGTNHYHMRICCKINGPCELGQGHCNSDNECADGLLCGRNNCKKDFSNEYTLWSNHHNCCYCKLWKLRIIIIENDILDQMLQRKLITQMFF